MKIHVQNMQDNIEQILKHVNNRASLIPEYRRLIEIYSGNLVEFVKAEISKELGASSYAVASKRIASINLLERIISKLSKVYSQNPKRQTPVESDQEMLNYYEKTLNVQSAMSQAEIVLNLTKHCLLEPYVDSTGQIAIRVLAPHEFTVYSSDLQNPTNPTAVIKHMGSVSKGKQISNLYWIYTAESFVIADSDGEILEQQPNPYGVIPFVYLNSDRFHLQPAPDNDSYQNSILIPKLLTDLNYAVQFQSHSIMYGIDVDTKNLTGGPDAFWSIKSADTEGAKPSIGVLSPQVDVDKVLALITFTVSEWLTSKGIRPGSVGSLQPANAASGVSKIVDESDTSQIVDKNRILLVKAEKELWLLISKIHNILKLGSKNLSDNLSVSVTFEIQGPIKDPAERRAELKFQLDNKLISYHRALKIAHPDLSDSEIEKLKEEILSESVSDNVQPGSDNVQQNVQSDFNNGQQTQENKK